MTRLARTRSWTHPAALLHECSSAAVTSALRFRSRSCRASRRGGVQPSRAQKPAADRAPRQRRPRGAHSGTPSDLDSVRRDFQDGSGLDAAGPERLLRVAGSRITRPRSAVPDAVHAHRYADPGTRVGDDRHHLVGRSPGAIADVDRADGVTSSPPSDDGGFVIDEAEVVPGGRFPSCAAARPHTSPYRPAAQRGTP